MAHVRLLGALGYGVVTLLIVNNVDGASDYISELARTTVHFLSRSKERISNAASGAGADLSLLNDKIDRLSQIGRETVHFHHGPGEAGNRLGISLGWITTILGGTVATVLLVHFTGLFDMSGVMYVTQARFKTATEALERGVKQVGDALGKVRNELLAKLGVVEKNLDLTRAELKGEIQASSGEIRRDVKIVSADIKRLHGDVAGLDLKLDGLQDGVGELRAAIEHANRGIALLCHVVAESFFAHKNSNSNSGSAQDKALKDLSAYTKTSLQTLGSAEAIKRLTLHREGSGPIMRLVQTRTDAAVPLPIEVSHPVSAVAAAAAVARIDAD